MRLSGNRPAADPPTRAEGKDESSRLRRTIQQLEGDLAAKSDLLKEVNHRAKNNLQMAMAMLSMQALASDNSEVSAALHAAVERLGYLARVHELLYQRGDDIQEIDISSFLRDIGGALERAFDRKEVTLDYDAPPLVLDVQRAISIALIAGEALLNSYKYAFPAGASGMIEVVCKEQNRAVTLAIRDNGVGFPVDQRRGSLGMRLLRALGRSLGGETLVSGERGTKVEIIFPMAPAEAGPDTQP